MTKRELKSTLFEIRRQKRCLNRYASEINIKECCDISRLNKYCDMLTAYCDRSLFICSLLVDLPPSLGLIIYELYLHGEKLCELAKRYNKNENTIRILNNKAQEEILKIVNSI